MPSSKRIDPLKTYKRLKIDVYTRILMDIVFEASVSLLSASIASVVHR